VHGRTDFHKAAYDRTATCCAPLLYTLQLFSWCSLPYSHVCL